MLGNESGTALKPDRKWLATKGHGIQTGTADGEIVVLMLKDDIHISGFR